MAELLSALVKVKSNIIISGGTGSGKTTLLNILSGCIPHNERIVTIEDTAELQLQQDHVIRLETRSPNIEGKGENPCDVESAVAVNMVALKLLQSVRLGLPVVIGPEDWSIPQ